MGCDIHAYFEGLDKGQWHFLKQWDFGRSYQIFSKMSDGHGRGHETPISPAKGTPDNISLVVKRIFDSKVYDYHAFSWLSREELDLLHEWFMELEDIELAYEIEMAEEYFIGHYEFEDYRLVFAFDN
jgi:hypothetical protein